MLEASSWLRCWADHNGLPPQHVMVAETLVGADQLSTNLALRVPSRLARAAITETGLPRISPEVLRRYNVPLWRTEVLTGHLEPGETLSLTHGVEACLPYPIRAIALSPQPVVRGTTAVLMIETDGLAFCRVEALGVTNLCYRESGTRNYAFVGVPALTEPGTYALRVVLVYGGTELAFSLPLEVAAGRYGYQVIMPPPQLQGLMDPALMRSEEAYLEAWRTLRSSSRQWRFPLQPPLSSSMSISAGYGDRRSYGGVVNGYHSGVDYRAWTGVPVVAPADGVVVMTESLAVRGNAVLIDHGWGLVTGYWHLSKIHVQPGDLVERGQMFAEVGNTGLSTGAHLHWEVWANGVSVDGRQWLTPDGLGGISFSPIVEPMEANEVQ
ncbi:MAG: M23 family metallopeptidase [Anaerolineae bacterium]